MGKPFRNEFGWSITKRKDFETCRRLYWINSYGFWNGWRSISTRDSQLAYLLKKMTNLPMLAGSVVHETVESMIRERHFQLPLEKYRERARTLLRNAWIDSTQDAWERNPKTFANIFEHYYGLEIPAQKTDAALNTVLLCLANFYGSEHHQAAIEAIQQNRVRQLEDFQQVKVGDVRVNIMMDLAIMTDEHSVVIYDWKTGKEREEHDWQMDVYALYAHRKWGLAPENVTIRVVYLSDGTVAEKTGSREALVEARRRITAEAIEMQAPVRDKKANIAHMEDFPMTENKRACLRCAQFESCYGTRTIPQSVEELHALQV